MRSATKLRLVKAFAALTAGGTVFQINGCGILDSLENVFSNFNPCGTVLACDPVTYRFLTSGYRGPGVDPDIDPACTYPPFCPNDPFVATLGNP